MTCLVPKEAQGVKEKRGEDYVVGGFNTMMHAILERTYNRQVNVSLWQYLRLMWEWPEPTNA
jgi:hypothetical protein